MHTLISEITNHLLLYALRLIKQLVSPRSEHNKEMAEGTKAKLLVISLLCERRGDTSCFPC
jgi:hypothetical protein